MNNSLRKEICLFCENHLEILGALIGVQLICLATILVILLIIITITIALLTVTLGPRHLFSFYLTLNPITHVLLCVIFGYVVFMIYDIFISKSSSRGGGNRRSEAIRRARVFHYAARYGPVYLIKTAELDPNKNYIMGYHPHGVFSLGAAVAFGTEALKFGEMFPGITPHVATVKMNFIGPIARDINLGCGISEASKENIAWILTRLGSGNAVVLVVGGAREHLETRPGAHRLVLKDRKGFIRMAITTGSGLVPVYAFGENEAYTIEPDSRCSKVYLFLKRIVEIVLGNSVLNVFGSGKLLKYLLLPHRHPLYVVVGRPIPVDQCSNPDESHVEDVHRRYMKDLKQLFDDHKHKYDDYPTAELEFI